MKKLKLITALCFLISLSATAGREGNGGDAITCFDRPLFQDGQRDPRAKIVGKPQLKDYWEMEETLSGLTFDLGSDDLSYEEKVQYALDRLKLVDELRFNRLMKSWKDKSFYGFVKRGKILELDDANSIINLPEEGELFCYDLQIAYQRKEAKAFQSRVLIDKYLFDMMDKNNKAGLLLHELLYREEILTVDAQNSDTVRWFNAILSSSYIDDLEDVLDGYSSSYAELIITNGLYSNRNFRFKVNIPTRRWIESFFIDYSSYNKTKQKIKYDSIGSAYYNTKHEYDLYVKYDLTFKLEKKHTFYNLNPRFKELVGMDSISLSPGDIVSFSKDIDGVLHLQKVEFSNVRDEMILASPVPNKDITVSDVHFIGCDRKCESIVLRSSKAYAFKSTSHIHNNFYLTFSNKSLLISKWTEGSGNAFSSSNYHYLNEVILSNGLKLRVDKNVNSIVPNSKKYTDVHFMELSNGERLKAKSFWSLKFTDFSDIVKPYVSLNISEIIIDIKKSKRSFRCRGRKLVHLNLQSQSLFCKKVD